MEAEITVPVGLRMEEEVYIVDFMFNLYNLAGYKIDVETVSEFQSYMNLSYATVNEVSRAMQRVYKENPGSQCWENYKHGSKTPAEINFMRVL